MRISLLLLSLAPCACTGLIATGSLSHDQSGQADPRPGAPPTGPTGVPGAIGAPETRSSMACASRAGEAPLRRLTRLEYNNAVRDLLGDTGRPADAFSPDETVAGFASNAVAPLSQLHLEQYANAAMTIAARAATRLAMLLPCDRARLGDDACARQFVGSFGRRAYRRPLEPAESERLFALYQTGARAGTFGDGIRLALNAMLLSPHFLYRPEPGTPVPGRADEVALTDQEIAARVAALFWRSVPDDELNAAADAKALHTPEQIERQARRLLQDGRTAAALVSFHAQWLGLEGLARTEKSSDVSSDFPALRASMARELEEFVAAVLRGGDGRLETLLSATFSFADAPLARLYGVSGAPGNGAFARIELPARQRAGLLTQLGVLAVSAHPSQTSPVLRGKLIRESVLCQPPPPPPPNVANSPPDPAPGASTRERFAAHRSVPSCAGCHALIDPLGVTFEIYDPIGRYRATEGGKPVDASGELTGTDADGAVGDAVELSRRLATSGTVAGCVARQWFRFALGRGDGEADRCALAEVGDAFRRARYDVRELLVALATNPAFRTRRVVAP